MSDASDPSTARGHGGAPDRRVWMWAPGRLAAPDDALIGWRDVPLADPEREKQRALAFAERVGAAERVFASDRRRTRAIARTVARALGARLEVTAALREIHYGRWEGRAWGEIRRDEPEAHAAYMADWQRAPMPEGESHADLRARVERWWTALRLTGPIVVVAHRGSLRALAGVMSGWSADDAMGVALARGHYAVLDPDGAHPPGWNLPLPGGLSAID